MLAASFANARAAKEPIKTLAVLGCQMHLQRKALNSLLTLTGSPQGPRGPTDLKELLYSRALHVKVLCRLKLLDKL